MLTSLKTFLYTFTLLLLISCDSKAEIPSIHVQNDEVYFFEQGKNGRYNNQEDRKKSTNLIAFQLSNPTDKKLLFFIDQEELTFASSPIEKSEIAGLYGIVKDSISVATLSSPLINPEVTEVIKVSQSIYFYNDSLKRIKYDLLGLGNNPYLDEFEKYNKHAIVLHPKEVKTFYVLINLPIVKEQNREIGQIAYSEFLDLTDFHTFQFCYASDAKYVQSMLPDFVLKELAENQVEIFDGIIYSKPVPLKKR